MPGSNSITITGGGSNKGAIARVQEYFTDGRSERLPDLRQARYSHACAFFYNSNTPPDVVSYYLRFLFLQMLHDCTMLLGLPCHWGQQRGMVRRGTLHRHSLQYRDASKGEVDILERIQCTSDHAKTCTKSIYHWKQDFCDR